MNQSDFLKTIEANGKTFRYFDLYELGRRQMGEIGRLPYSIRILAENLLRKFDGKTVTENHLRHIGNWQTHYPSPVEIPYHPARVLMQDFTGVPAVVDLAAMRDAMASLGGDPAKVNPRVPVELVVDHSVQIDSSRTTDSLETNVTMEYERNSERYTLLKWAQKSFANFRVVPPNSGICHQVNLEHLGRVVIGDEGDATPLAYPDTVVGLDSHTTMINGIGVVGWGVGGIEAEAVMLGQPYYMAIPEVVGVRLTGRLRPGVTATDMVLTLTEMLRREKVVEMFVEYGGPGLADLSIPDRATIANMAPEYGAPIGFFPVDQKNIDYLEMTGREPSARLTESYARANGLFYAGEEGIEYSRTLALDLSTVEPSLAGPSRPQDRIVLSAMKSGFAKNAAPAKEIEIVLGGARERLTDGSVVIAAITSCTNTSNPHVLMGAGLLAREAVRRGLRVPAHVKTSFAPGSRVVRDYLESAGLLPYFEALGFHITAFGCTTCIGNSGPLDPAVEQAIVNGGLNVAAVLSGNRNFEARIHQKIKSNYLASPLLVIAFALAGRVDLDLTSEPVATDPNGKPVFLRELWPDNEEILALIDTHVTRERFTSQYGKIFSGDHHWDNLTVSQSTTFGWDAASTYIRSPPYFDQFSQQPEVKADIHDARIFLLLGDSVTTDHISPAGSIPEGYPAGRYLLDKGVDKAQFNSYGSRRGNHEVMMRGTFGNIRIRNRMVTPKEGALTLFQPEGREMFNYDAAMQYQEQGTPLVVLAGKEYGTGASRDWVAKGARLLGVQAVIAESYERIHRNNLVGMGVLPLVFEEGDSIESLGLNGNETITIKGFDTIAPRSRFQVTATAPDKKETVFTVSCRLDTEVDVAYFQHGGILPYVLRTMLDH